MKLARLRRICWRIHAPKWAFAPLSGEGAARTGGRWNEPGTPALYLAFEHGTAIREYEQDLGWRPGTLCAYRVDVKVADLRDAATLTHLGFTPDMVHCPWKEIAFTRPGAEVPSWRIAASLKARGAAGAVYHSAVDPSGSNLVMWRWNTGKGDRVQVIDPLADLPRNQYSWE